MTDNFFDSPVAEEELAPVAETMDLYDANKGKLVRTGGPYLDEIEAVKAEEWRAKIENREPDLENPPATVATVLVPKHFLTETDASNSHVSAAAEVENKSVTSIEINTKGNRDLPADEKQADWDNDAQKVEAFKQKEAFSG